MMDWKDIKKYGPLQWLLVFLIAGLLNGVFDHVLFKLAAVIGIVMAVYTGYKKLRGI
jgi:hypothetical protein